MVEATVQLAYDFDFEEPLFAAEIAAARTIQDPDVTTYAYDKFQEVLKEGVARRLGLRTCAFQLLSQFDPS